MASIGWRELQPSCRAGVVLAGAHMVQTRFRYSLVAIHPVPSERLARNAPVNNIPSRIVIITVGYLTRLGVYQQSHMPQHITRIELHLRALNPCPRSQRTYHILGKHLTLSIHLSHQRVAIVKQVDSTALTVGGTVRHATPQCIIARFVNQLSVALDPDQIAKAVLAIFARDLRHPHDAVGKAVVAPLSPVVAQRAQIASTRALGAELHELPIRSPRKKGEPRPLLIEHPGRSNIGIA